MRFALHTWVGWEHLRRYPCSDCFEEDGLAREVLYETWNLIVS